MAVKEDEYTCTPMSPLSLYLPIKLFAQRQQCFWYAAEAHRLSVLYNPRGKYSNIQAQISSCCSLALHVIYDLGYFTDLHFFTQWTLFKKIHVSSQCCFIVALNVAVIIHCQNTCIEPLGTCFATMPSSLMNTVHGTLAANTGGSSAMVAPYFHLKKQKQM